MKQFQRGSGLAGQAALFAAALCLSGTAAHAQFIRYSTSFYNGTTGSPDIVNSAAAPGFTTYTSPNAPTDNLAGQNNWATTDPVGATGGTQVNGGTDYVGNFGTFFGDTAGNTNFAAAIGGEQRNSAPTAATPDVVPSAASGGVVSLYHPASGNGATGMTINVDFALTSPTTFTTRDSFAFSLRSTTNVPLMSINFTPAPGGPPAADNVTTTVGTATNVSTGLAVVLSGTYHLRLVLTPGTTGTYVGTLTNLANNVSNNFSGSLSTSSITLTNVSRFSADWTLASSTVTNGGYTGAGDNALAFDNLVVNVPEPSTYAMLAVGGLFGLVGARRWHARQA